MADGRDYNAAITALNTLQSNFSILDAIRKSGKARNKDAIPEMKEWCRRIGYEPRDFDRLNAIHVAGTKGKGSTSAFISSILSQYLKDSAPQSSTDQPIHPPTKIGLYTSPHLRFVRERIQINNEPLTEPQFAQYFFEVWDRLEASAAELGLDSSSQTPTSTVLPSEPNTPAPTKPVYFRYLTLMALHAYLREGVDTAVIECGIGGEYDSTNILHRPSVTAITSLGIDHTAVLGETIEEIAWHKAGIFKPQSLTNLAFTVASQPAPALTVLQQRADAAGVTLCTIPRHPDIASGKVKLGLAADFQITNASLAVAVAAAHLRTLGFEGIPDPESQGPLPEGFRRGLEMVRWGGRCEVRREGKVTWHLDGGHTLESIRLAAQWFASCLSGRRAGQKRVLVFNQQTRDAPALARALHSALAEAMGSVVDDGSAGEPLFTHAIFSTNITFAPSPPSSPSLLPTTTTEPTKPKTGRYKPDLMSMNTSESDVSKLTVQQALAEVWGELDPGAETRVVGTIEEAVRCSRDVGREGHSDGSSTEDGEVMVLVTGSLHLVGGLLEVLETKV